MSNATDPPQSQAPIRPAVFDMKGGEKAHLATITLSRDQQNNCQAQIGGATDSDVVRVRASLERHLPRLSRARTHKRAAISGLMPA